MHPQDSNAAGKPAGKPADTRADTAANGAALQRQRRRLIAARRAHWGRTRRITAALLLVWLATGFGTVFFARELAHWTLFGWPLSFYMAAQGACLVYLAILGLYVLAMRRADRLFAAQLRPKRQGAP